MRSHRVAPKKREPPLPATTASIGGHQPGLSAPVRGVRRVSGKKYKNLGNLVPRNVSGRVEVDGVAAIDKNHQQPSH